MKRAAKNNKLTAKKCREEIQCLKGCADLGIEMSERNALVLQAFEIALTVLERQGKEQHIGVWNPSTKEIAVNHTSGIKLVDIAHWHCHCTMEVIVREMCDHPAVKARNAQIEPQTDTYRQIENDGWIEWGGDTECPVPDGTKVDIKFRDGDVFCDEDTNWDWSWDEDEQGGADIIAYRVIENDGREG